jgi:hypothetical protein
MKTLIQLADDPTSSPEQIRLLAADDGDQLPILSYLVTETPHGNYFMQTDTMRRNLNLSARGEFDPASLVGALKVLEPKSGYQKEAIWRTAEYYDAEILACDLGRKISAPLTRPGAGTLYRPATCAEICRYTGLPQDGPAIGTLSHARDESGNPIPIKITERILRHGILLGGTVGYGKTNTDANLIKAARDLNFASIVFDHKPDYIRIREPNPDIANGEGIGDAQIWTLGGAQADAHSIYVPASELHEDSSELLAATIFYRQSEELQAETFSSILNAFADERNGPWGWQEFIDWFSRHNAKELAAKMAGGAEINSQVHRSIAHKIRLPSRIPKWMREPAQQFTFTKGLVSGVNFFDTIEPRSTHVVRLDGEQDGRGYALFLNYCLKRMARRRRNGGPKIFNMIDEASAIFHGNRFLRDIATTTLVQHVQQGRSLKICFAFSMQSAGDASDNVLQCINTVIVFKHKNPSVLKEILPEQAHKLFGVVSNLQRGEALVQLEGVRGILHANMYRSPFKLYEPDEDSK